LSRGGRRSDRGTAELVSEDLNRLGGVTVCSAYYYYMMTTPLASSDVAVEKFRTKVRIYIYTYRHLKVLSDRKRAQRILPSTKEFPVLQSTTTKNILYCRMHVSACRKQRAHVLRGVRETHVLQLLKLNLESLLRRTCVRRRRRRGGTAKKL